ncbi:hypothetical protein Ccrd_017828 [Cynara cardunculus var. scolymus]|uniref:Uncharacterized protein n=1 Tax=Cynara cardunculus var. scolymus TaxID=59895 RepID=A0A103Y7C2_CYNCS|nr:hypothetical protein Ccrd_017828 [Cynara cardunculus var. scolymus]
MTSSHGNEFC